MFSSLGRRTRESHVTLPPKGRLRQIVRPCLQRPRGRKKRDRIPPRRLLRRKIVLQQKVILKDHSFLNNLSTFSYQGKHPLALLQFLHLRPYPQRSKNSYMNLVIYFPKRYPLGSFKGNRTPNRFSPRSNPS